MTARIDPQTAVTIAGIMHVSRQRGIDPVPVLDAGGYLRHPAQMQRDREQVIREIHNLIDAATPTQLGGGRVPATAADMKRHILETIKGMVG